MFDQLSYIFTKHLCGLILNTLSLRFSMMYWRDFFKYNITCGAGTWNWKVEIVWVMEYKYKNDFLKIISKSQFS